MSATELLEEARKLKPNELARFIELLARQTDWLEDVIDSAIADARRDEPERPLSELLTRHGLA
ncbi:hypothetical protein LBMAG56_30080 [Verrucomicrobiota bacterium]|nr:hypothetical protein LBMAG56_30080 [Verrucomicrobiota bacterium]